ncbi:MAG TPA: S41 family peptidase [Urbifossiella sp.]|jgi:C-terminal processing protease CtpA/Prc
MVGWAAIGVLMIAPGAPLAPVPQPAPAPAGAAVDRNQAIQFAHVVYNASLLVREYFSHDVDTRSFIAAAIRGLYEEAGLKVPDDVSQAVARAGENSTELLNVLVDARVRLGNIAALSGPRSLFAAVNGFKYATDPICGLASPRVNSFTSVDMDFDIGLELDGVSGQRWSIYRMERAVATGALPPTGIFGPLPRPDAVPSPANFPWRVKRVIPGSPAQKAGVRPGDIITHLDSTEVTAKNANRLFTRFAYPPGLAIDPNTGQATPHKRTFKFQRAGTAEPIERTLETQQYAPEAVFGVIRTREGKWDCMLDRANKIGYIRIGPIEEGADERFGEMLDDLTRKGCRALILDLRWCPGGYVMPGTRIAGMLLKNNDIIAQVNARRVPNGFAPLPEVYHATAPFAGRFPKTPVLLLIGAETTGGGELIAAALQDNHRCTTMGQRSAGRASIQNAIDIGFGQLQFKVTSGATLRPNGKARGKLPDSKPTDEWGIRPDPGLEVPITPDVAKKLRAWADEQALRPAESDEALPFDDPRNDPLRAAALAHLRRQLDKSKSN